MGKEVPLVVNILLYPVLSEKLFSEKLKPPNPWAHRAGFESEYI
jgi:hypothetical protein